MSIPFVPRIDDAPYGSVQNVAPLIQRAHVAVPATPAVEPVMALAVAVPFEAAPKAVALNVAVERAVCAPMAVSASAAMVPL